MTSELETVIQKLNELSVENEHLKKAHEDLADRLRTRDDDNLRLTELLTKHGIEFQEVE